MYFGLNFIDFLCFTSKHFPRTPVLKHLYSVPAYLYRVFKFCLRTFSDLRRSYVLEDPYNLELNIPSYAQLYMYIQLSSV